MKSTFKTLGISLFLLSAILINSSCKKEEKPVITTYAEENFFTGFLQNIGFDQLTANLGGGHFELGLKFTPLVSGKINSLKVKLPAVNNSLRVTIWDTDGQFVIASYIVNVSAADTEITHAITPLTLQSNKTYMITMNENNYFYHNNSAETDATYPVTIGNIRIEDYGYIAGSAQQYPDTFMQYYIAGDLSFNFQRI
jgi:hypothetical protein